MSLTSEQYENKIKELEKEIAELKKRQTVQMKRQQYGLTWIDVPEAFDKESENKIPVLEEVKDKAISNDDGKPTHILIEGDNYHALQCLNYTHKGKVDVIYIDPPYNTGSDGFIYKDARFLDKYPDGSLVDSNHPLKHSYWLSFMEKRLKLAKNLLSDKGAIFISIDDNEITNLDCLCSNILGDKNRLAILPRVIKKGGKSTDKIAKNHDYIVIYAKNIEKIEVTQVLNADSEKNLKDEFYAERGAYRLNQCLDYDSLQYNESMDYEIEIDGEKYYAGGDKQLWLERHNGNHKKIDWVWRWSKPLFEWGLNNGFIVIKNGKRKRIYTKTYTNCEIKKDSVKGYYLERCEDSKAYDSLFFTDNIFSNDNAKKEFDRLAISKKFDYPKPTSLICEFEKIIKSSSTILDFFAGSGTTLHATMKLNAEDGGNRQCILVQAPENNICEEVTYERNRRVMQGYTNSKGEQIPGLGNSLKYYKTAFVGNHDAINATDDDCVTLAKKAGCLLSIGENTLDEIQSTNFFQIYEDKNSKLSTAIYFTEELSHFDEFVESVKKVASNHKTVLVYTFSWSSCEDFIYEFEGIPNVEIKAIPQPILEIYKSIYQK